MRHGLGSQHEGAAGLLLTSGLSKECMSNVIRKKVPHRSARVARKRCRSPPLRSRYGSSSTKVLALPTDVPVVPLIFFVIPPLQRIVENVRCRRPLQASWPPNAFIDDPWWCMCLDCIRISFRQHMMCLGSWPTAYHFRHPTIEVMFDDIA